jgi:hypothetical protein
MTPRKSPTRLYESIEPSKKRRTANELNQRSLFGTPNAIGFTCPGEIVADKPL